MKPDSSQRRRGLVYGRAAPCANITVVNDRAAQPKSRERDSRTVREAPRGRGGRFTGLDIGQPGH